MRCSAPFQVRCTLDPSAKSMRTKSTITTGTAWYHCVSHIYITIVLESQQKGIQCIQTCHHLPSRLQTMRTAPHTAVRQPAVHRGIDHCRYRGFSFLLVGNLCWQNTWSPGVAVGHFSSNANCIKWFQIAGIPQLAPGGKHCWNHRPCCIIRELGLTFKLFLFWKLMPRQLNYSP